MVIYTGWIKGLNKNKQVEFTESLRSYMNGMSWLSTPEFFCCIHDATKPSALFQHLKQAVTAVG